MKYLNFLVASIIITYLAGCSSLKGGAGSLFNVYEDQQSSYSAIERVDLVQLLDPQHLGQKDLGCSIITENFSGSNNKPSASASNKSKNSAPSSTSSTSTESIVKELECAFAGFYNKSYDDAYQGESANRRNRVQDRIIAASNESCKRFQYALKAQASSTNFVLGAITTGLGAAGAISAQSTAQILSAGAGFTSGVRAEYNQDFFSTLAIEVIVKAFEQARTKTLETIENKRSIKLALNGQGISNNKSINEYSVQMAIADAITYHSQCSLTVGLEEASRSLTLVANPGAEQLKQAMGIVDQLRTQQATGGKDISLGEGGNLQSLLLSYANDIWQKKNAIFDKLSFIENNLKNNALYVNSEKIKKLNDDTNDIKSLVNKAIPVLTSSIDSFSNMKPDSYLNKADVISTTYQSSTNTFFKATSVKDSEAAYQFIVQLRDQAVRIRSEIDNVKRKADDIVKDFNNKSQVLLSDIEKAATTPVFTTQPANATIRPSNDIAEFSVVLTGNATSKIQWQHSLDGKKWEDETNANDSTYKISEIKSGVKEMIFRAVARDKSDNLKTLAESNSAILTVAD